MANQAIRSELHKKGQASMYEGRYDVAAEIFQEAIQYGSHVGLLSDLIASDYMLGKTDVWISNLTKLSCELQMCRELLSADSLGKTLIFIGKMNEEMGEVQLSLKYFQEAAELAQVDREIRLNALAQALRLKTYLGMNKELSAAYMMTSQSYLGSSFHQIEVEHSLLLAELALFGPHTAFSRLVRLWNHSETLASDKRLILFDYIEYLFRRKIELGPELKPYLDALQLSTLDHYEKCLHSLLVLNQIPEVSQRNMSPFGYMKCLGLIAAFVRSGGARDEVLKKIFFNLENLSYSSRSLILNVMKLDDCYDQVLLTLDRENLELKTSQDLLPLKAGSFSYKCLEALEEKSIWSTDEFIAKVFDGERASLTNLEKTRIAIQRLNTDIRKRLGIAKTVEFTKLQISLNKKITFGQN